MYAFFFAATISRKPSPVNLMPGKTTLNEKLCPVLYWATYRGSSISFPICSVETSKNILRGIFSTSRSSSCHRSSSPHASLSRTRVQNGVGAPQGAWAVSVLTVCTWDQRISCASQQRTGWQEISREENQPRINCLQTMPKSQLYNKLLSKN